MLTIGVRRVFFFFFFFLIIIFFLCVCDLEGHKKFRLLNIDYI